MVYNERRPKRLGGKQHVAMMNIALVAVGLFSLVLVGWQLPDLNSRLVLICGVIWLVVGVALRDD